MVSISKNSLLGALGAVWRKAVSPTETVGSSGTAIVGGYVQSNEKNANLSSHEDRYKTFSEVLANATIVAAGVRYFLNLTAKAKWTFVPADHPEGQKYAEIAERMLTEDPYTPWHRIVRRAAMYRFYGFSIQEWTARRGEDGLLTLADVAPRAQRTITRWDTTEDGTVLGVIQTSPHTMKEIYLPRDKLLYMVDDTLSDSPEGLGLFRHLVAPAQRLFRYEQLEGFGFETDLRGIPIGRAPFTELARMVEAGEITDAQRQQIEAPLRSFVENHIRTHKLGMLLDSMTYTSQDEAGRPSVVKQWDVELMKGSSTSFKENAAAIDRLNMEMARVLGVEQLLLGSTGAGSYALSKDKTGAFFLLVDGAVTEIKAAVNNDLLKTLWALNGFPKETMPRMETEATRFVDAESIAASLRDLALAGAPTDPDDPVVDKIRDLMGVPRSSSSVSNTELDLSISPPDDIGAPG